MLSESELIFGTHTVYDKSFFLQCLDVIIQFFDVAAALMGLTDISLSDGIKEMLKYFNLSFTLDQALIKEDYETYTNLKYILWDHRVYISDWIACRISHEKEC